MKSLFLQLLLGITLTGVIHAQQAPTAQAFPSSVSKPPMVPANPNVMTPAEWAELRNARQAAMKADPTLTSKLVQLSQKMRAFQAKLHAAMVADNPNVAPIIAKLEGGSRVPPSPLPPQPNAAH